jgi:hypothetical protein
VRRVVGGGALFVAALVVLQGARIVRRSGKAIEPWAIGVGVAAMATALGVWLWRRTVGMKRLAAREPQLRAIYVALEADRKAGRLKV